MGGCSSDMCVMCIFFFKQKTAYEMRISDWSSDVCSSDLLFHTSNPTVWEYVNRFTDFTSYVHRVYTAHRGIVFPLPINLGTINQFFQAAYTPDQARALIHELAGEFDAKQASNLEIGRAHV